MGNIEMTTDHSLVLNKVSSEATWSDITLHVAEYLAEWKGKYVLWDMNAFDFSSLSTEDFRSSIANLSVLSELRNGEKAAIVVEEDYGFGMMRMFEMMAELGGYKTEIEVFRTIEKAKAWFGES